MKKQICFFLHTEYHLLLSLHYIMQEYSDATKYDVSIILKRAVKSTRLKQDLDFSNLPYNFIYLDFNYTLDKLLSKSDKENVEQLLNLKVDTFIFFQEQDPIAVILINNYKTFGTNIYLFQDGIKPYIAHTMSFSPSLLLNNIRQNRWIRKNGYPITDNFSFINCKMYGFLRGIDKLFLTFPDAYINWNKLPLAKLQPVFNHEFLTIIKRVFCWQDSLINKKEDIIFFMNQPMHDDGSFEVNLLQKLQLKYPEVKIYIKNHPLTSQIKLDAYKKLDNVTIINSKIPAEIFISQLTNSIILSVYSTSMFIDNPACKFYYTFAVEECNNIKRLNKYKVMNPTPHVISVNDIEQISF